MKPNPPVKPLSRVIPVFSRILPHELNYQCLSRKLCRPVLTTQQQLVSKSIIDDEAELSDWVRSDSSRPCLSNDERGGGRGRRVRDSDDYGMSNWGMGRDSIGLFSRNSSEKAWFGAHLEGENDGFVSQRRGGKDLTIAKRGVRVSDLGYGGDQVGRGGGRGGGADCGGGLKKGGESSGRGDFVSSNEETGDDDDDDENEEEGKGKGRLMKNFRDLICEEDNEEDDGDDMLENGGSLFANSFGRSDPYLSEIRFDQCSVSPLSLKGIKDAGYEKMIVVQEATLPVILKEVNFALDHLVMGSPQLSASEKGNSVTDSYDSWLLKHPSALDTFQQMMSIAKGRKIVVFLDYDGTLSNIVDNPEKAFMTNKMQMTLREVAHYFPTAIISGRSRDKVYDFVKLDNVYYAGSHGLDIAAPLQSPNYGDPKHQTRVVDRKGNEVVLFQPAKKYFPGIQKIFCTLIEKTRSIQGVMIEHNKFCISVHFRHVHDEDFCNLEKLVNSVMGEYKEFRISKGKKVFEIRPDMEWDKGHALNYLLDTLGLDNSSDVLPLYIGDDRTDEDAFKAIKNRGEGYPIVVSSIPKDTMALNSLRNPLEVQKFLLRLVRWSKISSSGKFVV